jgi:hypothetical protein
MIIYITEREREIEEETQRKKVNIERLKEKGSDHDYMREK